MGERLSISESDQALVEKAKEALLEHFDSVQIFVTRHAGEKDSTQSYECGGGNFYTRLGHVHEWITVMDQYSRSYAIRRDSESNE